MKKYLALLLLSLTLLFSSCVNFYPLPNKTFESETPYIYVSLNDPLYGGYKGQIENEDGEIIEVIVEFFHGAFNIYRYEPNMPDAGGLGDELLRGKYRYRERKNVLVFYLDDGSEIILMPIEEISE